VRGVRQSWQAARCQRGADIEDSPQINNDALVHVDYKVDIDYNAENRSTDSATDLASPDASASDVSRADTAARHSASADESAPADMLASREHERSERLVNHDRPDWTAWTRHVDRSGTGRRNRQLRARDRRRPERPVFD
jgi:hypothetical protein